MKTSNLLSTGHTFCKHCGNSHCISKCDSFLNLSTNNRSDAVEKGHLCLKYLAKGHNIVSCNCKYSCKRWNKKHHSLLHIDERMPPNKETNNSRASPSTSNVTIVTHVASSEISQIRLSTACFRVANILGSGTLVEPYWTLAPSPIWLQINFLKCYDCLDCPHNQPSIVIDKITEGMPVVSFDPSFLNIPHNLNFGEPTFIKEGNMLLGALAIVVHKPIKIRWKQSHIAQNASRLDSVTSLASLGISTTE